VIRFLTAGESHGPALIVIVEGLPAGMSISADEISHELARRRLGYGRGPRMRFEQDVVTLVGGVRHGRTLGSPVAVEIKNTEWTRNPERWGTEMSPDAAAGPVPGLATPVNAVSGTVPMREYVGRVCEALDVQPVWEQRDAFRSQLRADRARAWGWSPKVTFDEAMTELVDGLQASTTT